MVLQMGKYTIDQEYWGRPEYYTLDRPCCLTSESVGATDSDHTILAHVPAHISITIIIIIIIIRLFAVAGGQSFHHQRTS